MSNSEHTAPGQDVERDELLSRARRSLRLLQLHAGQRRKLEEARRAVTDAAKAELLKLGVEPPQDEWPALSAATELVLDLPATLRDQVLDKLPEPIRAELVTRLFSYESIPRQSDRTVQELVRAVDRRTLATALVGDEGSVLAAIRRNVSTRAAGMLAEDIESLVRAGELATRDVLQARETVGRTLYGFHESGKVKGDMHG
jgi:flagellar motor switch protein FliG